MKAKKLIAIVVLVAFGASAQAQIVSSRSDQVIVHQPVKVKKPRTFQWNIRAGYSFDNMTGGYDVLGTSGFDASFGISKPFSNSNLFWGVEAGIMSHGARMEDSDVTRSYGTDLAPRIGIKIPFAKDIALNIYGGLHAGYIFAHDWKYISYYNTDALGNEHYHSLSIYGKTDIGLNLGAELFVSKNFFFDLHVKKGFMSLGENHDKEDLFPLKIVLGIGVQF